MKYKRHKGFLKAFGANLKQIRLSHKFSQEKLANDADLDISQISRIERGITNTSISQLFIIARALNKQPKDLFDFEYREENVD